MMQRVRRKRKAFTLLEVLISIGLLGIVIVALFSTVSMMRDSNAHLLTYLEKAKKVTKATQVLYLDIISSDGNITIKRDEYARLCLNETQSSLYALSLAKVCWLVIKKDNTLVRIEGNDYSLPLRFEDKVEVDPVMKGVETFDVYHDKDKVLVLLKQKSKEPITFMVQGITKPKIKKAKAIPKKKNKPGTTLAVPPVVEG
jgi:prepilin-type N-terminal cleavage/methylation domain-containing protein